MYVLVMCDIHDMNIYRDIILWDTKYFTIDIDCIIYYSRDLQRGTFILYFCFVKTVKMSDSASEPSNIVYHPNGKSKVWKYFGFVADA